MKSLFLTFVLFPMGLAVSCTNSGKSLPGADHKLPAAGIIHQNLSCGKDSSVSYALFIPSSTKSEGMSGENGQSSTQLFPVMLFFDPHGDGKYPLTLYKRLAEKYHFILVGSNNSRNGLPMAEVSAIVQTLATEIHTRLPADTARLMLAGFSGGARVASSAALYQVPVKGVIICGAGFGATNQPVRYKFDLFGMAGTADFNMNELLQLEAPLSQNGFRHCLTTFNGKHEWPPLAVMDDAFLWMTLQALKDGMQKKDDSLIRLTASGFHSQIDSLRKKNELLAAAERCRMAISFLTGLSATASFASTLSEIERLPGYISRFNYREKVMQEEELEKQNLMADLQGKDLNWWRQKITDMKRVKKGQQAEDTLKDRRLLAFLSLVCYMNAQSVLTRQPDDGAIRIIAIYEMADPTNPEPNYMRAILFARRSNLSGTVGQLRMAISKGFSDKKRLLAQSEFKGFATSPEWIDLIKLLP